MQKLINDLKHLVNPVNPVKKDEITKQSQFHSAEPEKTKRTQNMDEASRFVLFYPPKAESALLPFTFCLFTFCRAVTGKTNPILTFS